MSIELQPERVVLADAALTAASIPGSPRHTPEFHIRQASRSSVASQQVEVAPAYLLEWDAHGCTQRDLASVEDLREEILRLHQDVGLGLGRDARRSSLSPIEVLNEKPGTDGIGRGLRGRQRLFIVHGLPAEHLKALRNSLEIDPAFIEAHAGRRGYRPLRWRRHARFAHYEYPEIVRGHRDPAQDAPSTERRRNDSRESRRRTSVDHVMSTLDLMDSPPVKPIYGGQGDDDELAVVICRASLWMTDQADVLFLDRPIWKDPSSHLRKAKRPASVTRPFNERPRSAHGQNRKPSVWDVTLAEGEEIGSLEEVLHESLKDASIIGDALMDILSRLAFDHWVELLEIMNPAVHQHTHETSSLLWSVMQALEQNADMVTYINRQGRTVEATYKQWQTLIVRTHRRLELVPVFSLPPTDDIVPSQPSSLPPGFRHPTRQPTFDTAQVAAAQIAASNASQRQMQSQIAAQEKDESQRALNRVAYMGGILIPVSIVSGILSMGDPWAPGQDQFWIFWAVSVPFVAFTMLIIYVDIIRKAEVWVEVTAENVLAAAPEGISNIGNVVTNMGNTIGIGSPRVRVDTITEKTDTITYEEPGIIGGQPVVNGQTVGWMSTSSRRRPRRPGIAGHAVSAPAVPTVTGPGTAHTEPVTTSTTYTVDEERIIDMPSNRIAQELAGAGAPAALPDGEQIVPAVAFVPPSIPLETSVILEQKSDGSEPKAWKLQPIGWTGALKALVGLAKPRQAMDIPSGIFALERRKTRTY
jgi:Mg2+ and Co2+ transporter CorA